MRKNRWIRDMAESSRRRGGAPGRLAGVPRCRFALARSELTVPLPVVNVRGRAVKALGLPGRAEGRRDLTHLARPAPALGGRGLLGSAQALGQLRLRARPL